ncbi:acyltransferase family protein [Frigidibacter sp. MR17.24]|uniref:acyltransferase family protein n=1 Tax=Frigidibacter sp. MR17.24 TaxID=3127345 RepID=UPI003013020A
MTEVPGLNWLRGLSAILVLLAHDRPLFYADYPDMTAGQGPLLALFYLVTSLGSSAVMVFFVLSGYLVASSADRAMRDGRWSWGDYLTRRFSRLWAVLIPCLLLTLACDWTGMAVTDSPTYLGEVPEFLFPYGRSIDLSPSDFFGNILFLQGILVFPYGSNGPLWSISYEFWYYLFFPLLALAWRARRRPMAMTAQLLLAAVVAAAVGRSIVELFPIWLMGFAAYRLQDRRLGRLLARRLWAVIAAVALLCAVLVVVRVTNSQTALWGRYALGLSTALLIPALHHPVFRHGRITSRWLSNLSYSLYLSHFPVQALISALNGDERSTTFAGGFEMFLLGLVASAITACLVYALFERRTPQLRLLLRAPVSTRMR